MAASDMRYALLACLLAPSVAAAHITLTYPPPRTADQKQAHCGRAGSARANVTTLEAGATITVRWRETVDHPGHYRISFDADGEDFLIPPTKTDSTEGHPTVIKDLIPDVGGPIPSGGRPYSFQITLPDIECDNCTLQLIQMMTEAPGYDPNRDLYFQCADLVLERREGPPPDAGMDGGDDGGMDGGDDGGPDGPDAGPGGAFDPDRGVSGGEGCSATGGATGLALAFAPLLLGLARRRRS